jgi:DNA adenine methylase
VFQKMRERDPDAMKDDVDVAVWLIYLNKTAFNGLYRVNKKGRFNVPFGRYERPKICDSENLRACSRFLGARTSKGSHAVSVLRQSFEDVLFVAKERDLVYFDPPYPPLSKTSSFASYTDSGFPWSDQVKLRDVALELKMRGAFVVLSNSDQPRVRDLYSDPRFRIESVLAARAINSKGSGRGGVGELIIT